MVLMSGDIGRNFELNTLECDVAVLQGFVHEHSKNAPI